MHQAESYLKDSKAFMVRTARVPFSDLLTPHAGSRIGDVMMEAALGWRSVAELKGRDV